MPVNTARRGDVAMARNESDREDLMREAVSLTRRIECTTSSGREPMVIGFNSQGWLFVYVGQDLMYRFDELGRLRRSFADGVLYRTEGTTLAMLTRQRTRSEEKIGAVSTTTLVRRDLSLEELERFRLRMRNELAVAIDDLRNGTVTRQYPVDAPEIVAEIKTGMQRVLENQEFLAPRIVRR